MDFPVKIPWNEVLHMFLALFPRNHIFVYLTFDLTFDLEDDLES